MEDQERKAKALAYLTDYVRQMRGAGFPDFTIKKKLLSGSVNVPNTLPEGFGQGADPWSTGMSGDLEIPSPDQYREYQPGGVANRMPTYAEYSGQGPDIGKWGMYQRTNLMNYLQSKLATYEGARVGPSQYGYESGMVGLPQDLANQWMPQMVELAKGKADEAREKERYEEILLAYPKIDVQPDDSVEVMRNKIREYMDTAGQQEVDQESKDFAIKVGQELNEDWIKAKQDDWNDLLEPITFTSDGVEQTRDPMDMIVEYIRRGESLDAIWEKLIEPFGVSITDYQLLGLYYIYGRQ